MGSRVSTNIDSSSPRNCCQHGGACRTTQSPSFGDPKGQRLPGSSPGLSCTSTLMAAQPLNIFYHAICRFADDGANFSINSDDPMVTGTWTQQEYQLVESWGLVEAQLAKCNVNAIKASFLPEGEKEVMVKRLYAAYGLEST